eukprot:5767100-Prymnesium_polylepis.2
MPTSSPLPTSDLTLSDRRPKCIPHRPTHHPRPPACAPHTISQRCSSPAHGLGSRRPSDRWPRRGGPGRPPTAARR